MRVFALVILVLCALSALESFCHIARGKYPRFEKPKSLKEDVVLYIIYTLFVVWAVCLSWDQNELS